MYPITPAKLNAATITMANMAAPPGGSFLSQFDTPENEWSIPFLPESGSLFYREPPRQETQSRNRAAGDSIERKGCRARKANKRSCSPAAKASATRWQRVTGESSGSVHWLWLFSEVRAHHGLRFYARTDLASIRKPR